jgi:uridine kinase
MSSIPGVNLKVAVVGACASGKSTLVSSLREVGYKARHVAQDHSYVPNTRRPHLDFRPEHLAEQNRRLAHARQHCHLYLDTNELNPTQVQDQTLSFLKQFRPE